jgi:hypothetical protein
MTASLAGALHQYCESVLMQVPRNTPQQDRWVDSEFEWHVIEGASALDERYQQQMERIKRVENPVEYARKHLRGLLSRCSSLTKNLIELNQTTPTAEALLWIRLSNVFVLKEFLLGPAEIVELVSPNYCKDEAQHVEEVSPPIWPLIRQNGMLELRCVHRWRQYCRPCFFS